MFAVAAVDFAVVALKLLLCCCCAQIAVLLSFNIGVAVAAVDFAVVLKLLL